MKSIPFEEQDWDMCIATTKEGGPVYVVGIIYEQGQEPPDIPPKLATLYPNQTPVQLPLAYPDE